MPIRRQAIIWGNVGRLYWRICTLLGLKELNDVWNAYPPQIAVKGLIQNHIYLFIVHIYSCNIGCISSPPQGLVQTEGVFVQGIWVHLHVKQYHLHIILVSHNMIMLCFHLPHFQVSNNAFLHSTLVLSFHMYVILTLYICYPSVTIGTFTPCEGFHNISYPFEFYPILAQACLSTIFYEIFPEIIYPRTQKICYRLQNRRANYHGLSDVRSVTWGAVDLKQMEIASFSLAQYLTYWSLCEMLFCSNILQATFPNACCG